MLRQAINLFLPAAHPKGSIRDVDFGDSNQWQAFGAVPAPTLPKKDVIRPYRIKVEAIPIKC
jgi:hypothetical protein